MFGFSGKRILLGVTGSISVYKACEVARRFIKGGAEVRVVMTNNAARFVSPMLFEVLTNAPALSDMFPESGDRLAHVDISAWADLFLIAPATANFIGKAAAGIADDLLTSTLLAFDGPVLVAPAMNDRMWANTAVQENVSRLRERGFGFVGPGNGELACGDAGPGRLADIEEIIAAVEEAVADKTALSGKRVLISAGPTREYLDDVRFLSNPSTGRMGYAIAHEAYLRGADVTLVSGQTSLAAPFGVRLISVTTAAEMADELFAAAPNSDVIIMSAAVADWSPKRMPGKVKKAGRTEWNIELRRTKDILAELGERKKNQTLVGFAVETENEIENARKKISEKNLDMLFVNNPNDFGAAFGTETNRGYIVFPDSAEEVELVGKDELAGILLDRVERLLLDG
ncbi:bifunctional phosphopantothenoylcysteine decarboxylase/phosphopantothenate--cysteine ligase CoaBC [bacterium]|nr:bifunctional phosphopantothenoylcysteine decarboxylase/phosphopantothenate--cysteine ligase CoaBC [bacterium]